MLETLESRRLLTLLVPDLTWGANGAVPGLYDSMDLVGVSDGRVVSALSFQDESSGPSVTFTRTLANGTNDPRFRPLRFYGFGVPADLDSQNRLVVGAPDFVNPYVVQIGRHTASGNRDDTFGRRGKTTFVFKTPYPTTTAYTGVRDIETGPDGSVVALIEGGRRFYNNTPGERRLVLARFTPAGVLDPSFGQGGLVDLGGSTIANAGNVAPTPQLHLDARGRVYLAGTDAVTRLRANGTRDRAFATNGQLALNNAAFTLDTHTRPVIADRVGEDVRVRRFDTTGQPDSTFYDLGEIRIEHDADTLPILLALPDAGLLVQSDSRRIELHPERDDVTTDDEAIYPIAAVLPDGSVLGTGNTDMGRGLVRLTNASPIQMTATGILRIWGADAQNDVAYVRPESGGRLRIGLNGKAIFASAAAIRSMEVDLGDGDNRFTSTADVRTSIHTGSGHDILTATPASATVYISAGAGNDHLGGGLGDDRLIGGDGDDTVYGNAGDDRIAGDAGNDSLIGGSGSDRINAGEGNDQLYGGTPAEPRITGITNYLFGHTGTDIAYLESDSDVADGIEQIV